ncbi:MAG TPA: hypothetical protein VFG69_01115 [Nannocystaceae bacterium]|nr:hypothetical protein [Nannocystaceae bacterium]
MRLRFLISLFPLLTACSVETTSSSSGDGERGGLGKADLVGSCEHHGKEFCGGKGKGNCWCDDACAEFGDCCSDADEVCGIDEPEPEGQACGGIAGLPCDEGEFCSFAPEAMCGAADQLGECVAQPEVCIALFQPVCGCDGETYGNSCNAAAAGVSVAHEGECEVQGEFCGGFGGIPCPDGKECIDDPNDDCDPNKGGADCGGICVDGPECPPVFCALFCENGFETDENGCEICSCKDDDDREIAEGQCIKNSLDECSSDADCISGGCGGELCFNPAQSSGISTCECTMPEAVSCGCVAGQCAWFE